jgi:hypothetical protein
MTSVPTGVQVNAPLRALAHFAAALLSTGAAAAEEPPAEDHGGWDRLGPSFLIGGGGDAMAFGPTPSAGVGLLETALNVGLAPAVDFRLGGTFGLGAGVKRDVYALGMWGLRLGFRCYPSRYYGIVIGVAGRVGAAVSGSERAESSGFFPLYGPELSLSSFRFGSRGQYELELDGGLFLPPTWGVRAGLALRYQLPQ